MATTFLESGTDATQDLTFWNGTNVGTFASDSTVAFTGTRSIKLSTSSPAVTASVIRLGVCADAGRRISFRYRTDTIPAAQSNIIRLVNAAGAVVADSLRLNTNGTLALTDSASTNGTTVLKVNQWYRITLSYTITSTTVWTFNVFLNGKLELTRASAATITISTNGMAPTVSSGAGTNVNCWFDDIYIDDGATLDDPGNIIVTNKRPNANGTLNDFTTQIGSGGSGYGTGHSPQVNEQPLSTTNGWSIASASAKVEEYTIENSATGDKDVSNARKYQLVDYMGWIYAKVGSAGTRNIVVNGSATNISVTNAYLIYIKAAGSTTYPSGATAIGMNNNSVNNLTSLAECGVLLAYKIPRRVSIS